MSLSRRALIQSAIAAGAFAAIPASTTQQASAVLTGPAYRAFKTTSIWNQPLPVNAPIDVDSARFIADAKAHSDSYLKLTLGSFAMPTYFATVNDPLRTVTDSHGRVVTLHIPDAAAPMDSNDAEFTVFDKSMNVCVGFHHAQRDAAGKITTEGLDRWHLDSNGLHGKLPQSDDNYNLGHRGSPAPLRQIRLDEVRSGLIAHKLAAYWWATAEKGYFPMYGYESGKGGVVPEGMQLRVKRSVDLAMRFTPGSGPYVIAKAFQDYGLYVGDNSGSGSRVKVERSSAWANLNVDANCLSKLLWDDYEFIQRGFGA
ncbi:MAG: hypothetical protein H0V07_13395 [Propionibacteriales bacterium]|nr:hypothetical protein [Propionibacteriales bacterium]